MPKDVQTETLSLEAARFCVLLARILCRAIAQQDARILALFDPSVELKKKGSGGNAA